MVLSASPHFLGQLFHTLILGHRSLNDCFYWLSTKVILHLSPHLLFLERRKVYLSLLASQVLIESSAPWSPGPLQ